MVKFKFLFERGESAALPQGSFLQSHQAAFQPSSAASQ